MPLLGSPWAIMEHLIVLTQIRHCVVFELDQPNIYGKLTYKSQLMSIFELKTGLVVKNVKLLYINDWLGRVLKWETVSDLDYWTVKLLTVATYVVIYHIS